MTKFVFQWSRCTEFGAFLMAWFFGHIFAKIRSYALPIFHQRPARILPRAMPTFDTHRANATFIFQHEAPHIPARHDAHFSADPGRLFARRHSRTRTLAHSHLYQQIPRPPLILSYFATRQAKSPKIAPKIHPCSYPLCLHNRQLSCILRAVDH